MRISGWLLFLSLAVPVTAPAQTLFSSGFENGDICGWDGAAGACVPLDDLPGRIVGTYQICISPMSMTYSYQPYPWLPWVTFSGVLCGQSWCTNGAAGCDVAAHVSVDSLVWDQASLTATLDDASLPVELSLEGATEDDTLEVTDTSAATDLTWTETSTCLAGAWEVNGVPPLQIDMSESMTFTGGTMASLANLALATWQPMVDQTIEQDVAGRLRNAAPPDLSSTSGSVRTPEARHDRRTVRAALPNHRSAVSTVPAAPGRSARAPGRPCARPRRPARRTALRSRAAPGPDSARDGRSFCSSRWRSRRRFRRARRSAGAATPAAVGGALRSAPCRPPARGRLGGLAYPAVLRPGRRQLSTVVPRLRARGDRPLGHPRLALRADPR